MEWFKLKVILFGAKVCLPKQLNLSHTKATIFRQQDCTANNTCTYSTNGTNNASGNVHPTQNQIRNNFVPFMQLSNYKIDWDNGVLICVVILTIYIDVNNATTTYLQYRSVGRDSLFKLMVTSVYCRWDLLFVAFVVNV